MKLHNPGATVLIPDSVPTDVALERITHLGIGAHSDDLEIMAFHGIAQCYDDATQWFGGVTCTDGAGCSRLGPFADTTDAQMRDIRRREQERAAVMGRYGLMAQLDYPSADLRGRGIANLRHDLAHLLRATRPRVVYTHSPADKHTTHITVLLATVAALRELTPQERPHVVYGCEAWRDLDWMDDDDKIVLDVGTHPELARKLLAVFESQIAGGKRYDRAAMGRRAANATFHAPRAADSIEGAWLAMDLTPLVEDDTLDVVEYVDRFVQRFADDIRERLTRWK